MTIHYAIVHYLQQWVNLKFDRCHLFYKEKKSSFGISVGDYEAKPLWHISQRVCSKLGLIFSLMHQSFPCVGILLQEGLLFSTLQLSFISFLWFLLKTLSEWERLSSDNSQLSTHLSIHPFIHLLPVSTFLYIKESLIRCYCCIPFDPSQMQRRNAFISCTLLHVCFVLCPSPLSVVFLCLPLLHTSILNMTKWLSVWWSIFKHLSHLSGPFHSLLFLQRKLCSQTFLLFLYHKSFIFHFFLLFIISCCLPFSPLSPISSLSLFFFYLSLLADIAPSSSPSHPELSYLAGVSAADVARLQTSASPCPAASLLCWSG